MSGLEVPDRRELLEERVRDRVAYRLATRNGRNAVVGTYLPAERWLVKRVDPDRHAYRNRPGIGWNLELLAILDRARPRPKGLAVVTPHRRYSVPWPVVVRYAKAAADGDPRYLITDDVDRQVLIPWEVLDGTETAPPIPARVLDGTAWHARHHRKPQPGPTLLDDLEGDTP